MLFRKINDIRLKTFAISQQRQILEFSPRADSFGYFAPGFELVTTEVVTV